MNNGSNWPKFALSEAPEAIRFFDAHGWVIFRALFSVDEIDALRLLACDQEQRAYEGDILSNPCLGGGNFILDHRIVSVARALLRGDPCYYGDSSVSIDVRTMGFHKDNPDRHDPQAPDWRGDYSQLRMGLYLQDHARHSGGLAIRDCSHMTVDHGKGEPIAMSSEVGDLVVWSLRTTHSGNALRPRRFSRHFVPVKLARQLEGRAPWLARLTMMPLGVSERIALFASFGRRDSHLDRYLAYLKSRQYAVRCWQQSAPYQPETIRLAGEQGVQLIAMQDAVQGYDLQSLNVKHAALATVSCGT